MGPPGMVSNPSFGKLNTENKNFSLSKFAHEKLYLRDESGRPGPRQSVLLLLLRREQRWFGSSDTKNIDIINIARERERAKKRSNPEGQKEPDLETQITIIRIYELLQVYNYFLYPQVILTHRILSLLILL